jgi:hypothetical protein
MNHHVLALPLLVATFLAPAVAQAPKASVPAEVVGEWRWGTINPGWFENKATGAYEGHAGGTAAYFVFTKDGRFRRYVYIETNSYGWRTQVMTTTEGTVAFAKDSFRLNVETGRYKSVSNRVRKHNFERPMTDDERAKDAKTEYRWKPGRDERTGKPLMMIGFGSDNLSAFQRER